MGAIYVAIVYPVRLTRNVNRASGEIERGNIVEEAEKRYRLMSQIHHCEDKNVASKGNFPFAIKQYVIIRTNTIQM